MPRRSRPATIARAGSAPRGSRPAPGRSADEPAAPGSGSVVAAASVGCCGGGVASDSGLSVTASLLQQLQRNRAAALAFHLVRRNLAHALVAVLLAGVAHRRRRQRQLFAALGLEPGPCRADRLVLDLFVALLDRVDTLLRP